ncbi:GNAT family N-acetyltransferase [Flavobacterium psychrotrophum]|uniref:GNAT family N-acetyltransferase n=1 Tax=Flavobacterium psychrotrophum TaxID=2294119 RepID=UPI000E317EFE|nr:GNAT family protein [Flavobacterium psychrotrophum]
MNQIQLKSDRLLLRNFIASDVINVHDLLIQPETIAFNPGLAPENEAATLTLLSGWQQEINNEPRLNYTFNIENTNKQFIGIISIGIVKVKYRNAEVWYKLSPDVWGKGYATEALNTVIKFGFEVLNLHRIEAGCAVGNIASYKVMEKTGMQREAHRRKLLPLKTGWSDNYEYAILDEDYFKGI